MRYFFLIYALLLMLVLLVFPNRLGKSSQPEWRIFPDMDEQDKLQGQRGSDFFANGRGARIPDPNTVPMGFEPLNKDNRNSLAEFGFSNRDGYAHTGEGGEGLPKELGIESFNDARQLLAQGEERYKINCSHCHGMAADGKGITAVAGFSGAADLMGSTLSEGDVFKKITHGGPIMVKLGQQISVKDRWAIVAYLRQLQEAKKATAEKAAK